MEKTRENVSAGGNEAAGKQRKNRLFGIVLGALILTGATYGIIKYIHSLHHEETDNAQVQADISPVIPRVSGYVTDILVNDFDQVERGDTLMVLDKKDLQIAVDQAEAALMMAESNLTVARQSVKAAGAQASASQAGITAADANIEAARVRLWRATEDFKRYENLVRDHSVTRQQYEQALAEKQTAERQLEVLEKQKEIAERKSFAATSQTAVTADQIEVAEAVVRQREAELAAAKLRLSYAVITAPAPGQVSDVEVEPGQYVQTGQQLFSIVMNEQIWVVANFKETQLEKMQAGQAVEVVVDAFPGHRFNGAVSSFSPATGARFALLPPDNSSGNFVKVVQRVPVKIEIKDTDDPYIGRLRAGMNAVVDVHID